MLLVVLLVTLVGLSKQHSKSLASSALFYLLTNWLSEERSMFMSPRIIVGFDSEVFSSNKLSNRATNSLLLVIDLLYTTINLKIVPNLEISIKIASSNFVFMFFIKVKVFLNCIITPLPKL